MKKVTNIFCITLLIICYCINMNAYAQQKEYKYVRTYNAEGNVVKEANANDNSSEYISLAEFGYEFMGQRHNYVSFIFYYYLGNQVVNTTFSPTFGYNSSNNGWDIYVSTQYYVYVKRDGSAVRSTFVAGGYGYYKEYIRQNRPKIDKYGPTY